MTVNQLVVGSIPTAGAKINAEKSHSLANLIHAAHSLYINSVQSRYSKSATWQPNSVILFQSPRGYYEYRRQVPAKLRPYFPLTKGKRVND